MPRKRTLSDEELWEQEVEDVVEGIKNGKYSSIRQAARLTGLSRTTITERLHGRPTRRKAHEGNQKLAHSEEDEIARAIRLATMAGKPLLPATLREMGNGIMKRRVNGVNEDGIVLDYSRSVTQKIDL
jgi:helix-turn-helix, Psq domain